jgi:hypothetical protein
VFFLFACQRRQLARHSVDCFRPCPIKIKIAFAKTGAAAGQDKRTRGERAQQTQELELISASIDHFANCAHQ